MFKKKSYVNIKYFLFFLFIVNNSIAKKPITLSGILNKIGEESHIGLKFSVYYMKNKLSTPNYDNFMEKNVLSNNTIFLIQNKLNTVPLSKKFETNTFVHDNKKTIGDFLNNKEINLNEYLDMEYTQPTNNIIRISETYNLGEKNIYWAFNEIFVSPYLVIWFSLLKKKKIHLFYENNMGFYKGFTMNNLLVFQIKFRRVLVDIGGGHLFMTNCFLANEKDRIFNKKTLSLDNHLQSNQKLYLLHKGIFQYNNIHRILIILRFMYNMTLHKLLGLDLFQRMGIEIALGIDYQNYKDISKYCISISPCLM